MSRRIFASSSTTRTRANTTPGRAQDGSALGTRLHQSRCRGRAAFSSQGAGLGILDGLESANVRFWPRLCKNAKRNLPSKHRPSKTRCIRLFLVGYWSEDPRIRNSIEFLHSLGRLRTFAPLRINRGACSGQGPNHAADVRVSGRTPERRDRTEFSSKLSPRWTSRSVRDKSTEVLQTVDIRRFS